VSPRFAANVSILFSERPFLDRFEAAARAGFVDVEFWWPDGEDLDAVRAAVGDAGVGVVLINFDGGDLAAGDRGLINDGEREGRFRDNVPVALDLARSVGCRQLNALVGLELPGVPREDQLARARDNVRLAARAAAPHGIRVLIEAINTRDNGPYLLASTADAAAFVREVGEPNVALQYDVFHMRRMDEDVERAVREHAGEIAHVQIADWPGRGEPGTGRIDFEAIYALLDELGYEGHVSAEYRPMARSTEDSLGWLR
jgi:hydroxypyruvate isomerase